MISSITPLLNGDVKTGQNSFLLAPVVAEDLHNSKSARNFWLYIDGSGAWSAAGNSPRQTMMNFTDNPEPVMLEAGFLWHKLTRTSPQLGITAEITNFVPVTDDSVELMRVKLTNTGSTAVRFTPTAAIPIYGRSATNIRDHRHVTSLLHRIRTTPYGVVVQPTFCFDERGHLLNRTSYGIFGASGTCMRPAGFFPVVEEFIGPGGSLEWPEAVVRNRGDYYPAGAEFAGYEAIGAIRFREEILEPGASQSFILILSIYESGVDPGFLVEKYGSDGAFERHLRDNKAFWQRKLDSLVFAGGDSDYSNWLRWVGIQPTLRRICGCSFLPYHDYGRGGRGWRDLWQDCLALLFQDPEPVRELLFNNYAGVRIDGSNATIVGNKPGEFIADRNNISRVWMDHGAWPYFTTQLYLDQSGDFGFLLAEQTYFKDAQINRSQDRDEDWDPRQGNCLRTQDDAIYRGSILEHILVELLVPFFNVGPHNQIRLENADWNDALDMAAERGESVAFTAFYGNNLSELGRLLNDFEAQTGIATLELAGELLPLLDTISVKTDWDSVAAKKRLLNTFYDSCRHRLSGRKVKVATAQLAADLIAKGRWIAEHIRTGEWVGSSEGLNWFNGYYDNDGGRVEGEFPDGIRITLTGQVFTVMGDTATTKQVAMVVRAVDRYLRDRKLGGYRLNSDFGGIRTNLGRGFGFAYGHKENGSVFSHMVVMYANALYRRGFVREGREALRSLYELSRNFESAAIYPGVPEYFDPKGRGMYPYLTGSASWYLLTVLTEVYGIKGHRGDLVLEPKLLAEEFDSSGNAATDTSFAGHRLRVVYHNPGRIDYGAYRMVSLTLNGEAVPCHNNGNTALIPREVLAKPNRNGNSFLLVELGPVPADRLEGVEPHD